VLRPGGGGPVAVEQALSARGIAVASIARVAPSLEDVFLDVVEQVSDEAR
jgi:hypothetical protein